MGDVRLMVAADMAAVLRVQAACYPPNLLESAGALLFKLERFPQSCWVAERGGVVMAYAFAHDWSGDLPPALDAPLAIVGGRPYFYLHDMAVHPDARGRGLGEVMWRRVRKAAREKAFPEIRLVAVEGAQHFWMRLGFADWADGLPGLAEKLREYGGQARLMRYCL